MRAEAKRFCHDWPTDSSGLIEACNIVDPAAAQTYFLRSAQFLNAAVVRHMKDPWRMRPIAVSSRLGDVRFMLETEKALVLLLVFYVAVTQGSSAVIGFALCTRRIAVDLRECAL